MIILKSLGSTASETVSIGHRVSPGKGDLVELDGFSNFSMIANENLVDFSKNCNILDLIRIGCAHLFNLIGSVKRESRALDMTSDSRMLANMLKAANKRSSPAFSIMDKDSPAARGLLDMRTNMRSDDQLLEYKKKSVRRLCTTLRPDSVSKP